jgi:carboxymethylenebutenolidase
MRVHWVILSLVAAVTAQAADTLQVGKAVVNNGDVAVPLEVAIPAGKGPFPPVLYIHSERGYDPEVDTPLIRNLATEGFLVVAPDWQSGRFIQPMPPRHVPETESDVEAALDFLRKIPEACRIPVGVIGYSRGGYYAIRLAAKRRADIGAIATYGGQMQNPNAPEPEQLFSLAPEVMAITAPVLLIIGDQDFELRRIDNGRAFYALYERGVPVEIQIYPLARRGFVFRSDQTPEEKIAANHAHVRVRDFLLHYLELDKSGKCR